MCDMHTPAERSSRKKFTQEQVDKALDDHAEWLENKTSFFGLVRAGKRADFTHCDLRDLDFSDRDLRHVIFKGALVTRAIFDGATLDSNLVFAPIDALQIRQAFSTKEIRSPATHTESLPPSLACIDKPSRTSVRNGGPTRAPLRTAESAGAVNVLTIAGAVSPSPSAAAADEVDLDWQAFVDSRTPTEPQRWAPSIQGHPLTWHPPSYPRPSAPPLEHGREL
jgi:hypothetical protein